MKDKLYDWLYLLLVFGPANERVWTLSSEFTSVTDFVDALKNQQVGGLTDYEKKACSNVGYEDVSRLVDRCNQQKLRIYSYESEGFPKALKRISNPPSVLFSNGSLDFLNDTKCIEIVGTRNPSQYTQEIVPKLCEPFCKLGYTLVSGFAEGVDRLANTIALENNASTVAFLGRPHEREQDVALMEKISNHGAVVSEFYPEAKHKMNAFVLRNRLMVGISDAVIICEAKADSRGLDNVSHAISQGKHIFVVPPHDIFDLRYMGQRDLLRAGCLLLQSSADVTSYLNRDNPQIVDLHTLDNDETYLYNPVDAVKEKSRNTNNATKKKRSITKNILEGYEGTKKLILKSLRESDRLADELSAQLDVPVAEIFAHLTELEMDGVVESLAGKQFGLNR